MEREDLDQYVQMFGDMEDEDEGDEFWAEVGGNIDKLCAEHQMKGGKQDIDEAKSLGGITNDKAGFTGVDVKKINQVIEDSSKNSRFYNNEQRKSQKTQSRIDEMLNTWSRMKDLPNNDLLVRIDKDLMSMESRRAKEFTKSFLHMDMDGIIITEDSINAPLAFYASVEIRDNPSLAGKAMAVGGSSMLSTSSYEARKFGVRSAMPGFIALKLCPELIIVPPNFDKYKEASERVKEVLALYDPGFISYSLDEASLNVTNYIKSNEVTMLEIAEQIQAKVFESTKLTCSLGGACNRRIAKICTNERKPNGNFIVPPDRNKIIEYVSQLPLRRVAGIGKVTEKQLNALGIMKVGDIHDKRAMIYRLFSARHAEFFMEISLGLASIKEKEAKSSGPQKSISTERTFDQKFSNRTEILELCKAFSEKLEQKLAKDKLSAKTVTIKLKTVHFEVYSRSFTVPKQITTAADIYKYTSEMTEAEFSKKPDMKIRLYGIRVSHLTSTDTHIDKERTILKFFSPKDTGSSSTETSPTSKIISNNTSPVYENKHTEGPRICPVCEKAFDRGDFPSFNLHVEKCLKDEDDEDESSTSPDKRSPIIIDLDSPSPEKSKSSFSTVNPGDVLSLKILGKKKTNNSKPNQSKKQKTTLDRFFKKPNNK